MRSHCSIALSLICLAGLSGCAAAGSDRTDTRPGIDVLLTDSLSLVTGLRVGLITNQTGVDRNGRSDVDRLLEAGVQLTTLFSPEHGFRGVLDDPNVGHSVDSATGIPIYSLYGEVRAPTSAMLSNVDVLLIDLQDIGARTYTYISTTLLAMRAVHDAGKRVLVLDRPNPIGGDAIQGPVLDSSFASFVGMLPVPMRHGMTLGELALFGNEALVIGATLEVVPASGWRRSQWFDQTGLPWVRPSPSMPSLESATHYPGLVLFEATNLSVGRGTPIAFQVVAAPWLSPRAVMERLPVIPGVSVADTNITPVDPPDGKFPSVRLPAIQLRTSDREQYDPIRTAFLLLSAIRSVHADSFVVRDAGMDRLAGTDRVRLALQEGRLQDEIEWQLEAFMRTRARHLLYE